METPASGIELRTFIVIVQLLAQSNYVTRPQGAKEKDNIQKKKKRIGTLCTLHYNK